MSFIFDFQIVRDDLSTTIEELISNNIDQMFEMWLVHEADIQQVYVSIFKKYYGEHITDEIEDKLWFAGENITFALTGLMTMDQTIPLQDVLRFTKKMLKEQLDNFENDYDLDDWSDGISPISCASSESVSEGAH